MGLGHSHYPVPWGALKYDTSLQDFRTNITEQQLRDAPEFSDDAWEDRNLEVKTHSHYRAPYYWRWERTNGASDFDPVREPSGTGFAGPLGRLIVRSDMSIVRTIHIQFISQLIRRKFGGIVEEHQTDCLRKWI